MSNYGAEFSKPPQRPKHQLSRSVSDIPFVAVPKGQQSHHHHHPYLHRHHKDDKTTQSGGPNLHPNVLEKQRSQGLTPVDSRNGSRRGSLLEPPDDNTRMALRRTVGDEELKIEKEKGVVCAVELSKSLADLNKLSNDTTRNLDNSYYSVLEKASTLQSTVSSLKELAIMMRSLNEDFRTESHEIERDITTQLDAFDEFREQKKKISGLEERIVQGRDKVKALGGRVDAVRHKVQKWEITQGQWQQKMRRRLRLMWGVMASILFILVVLLVFQYTPLRTQGHGAFRGLNTSGLKINMSQIEREFMNETSRLKRSATDALDSLRSTPDRKPEEDPRMRAFDEL